MGVTAVPQKRIAENAPELADAHRASDERKSVSSPMSSEQVGVVHQFADWHRSYRATCSGALWHKEVTDVCPAN